MQSFRSNNHSLLKFDFKAEFSKRVKSTAQEALYIDNSSIVGKGKDGVYNVDVKLGLFSKLVYKIKDVVAIFNGDII